MNNANHPASTCHSFGSLRSLFAAKPAKRHPVSPLFATLTVPAQIAENTTTLSLAVATLASFVKHNSFICHSYKKHPGSHLSSPRSFRSGFSRSNFLPARRSPLATISFTTLRLRAVLARRIRTSEKSARNSRRIRTSKTQDLKSFRMNTSEKTPGGRAHPSSRLGQAGY